MTICRWASVMLASALIAGAAPAGEPVEGTRASSPKGLQPSLALMRAVTDAWETRDPSRAAPFYAREAERVFFDVSPLQYQGWETYAAGASIVFRSMRSMRITLLPGAAVHTAGRSAWGTATMRYAIELEDGKRVSRDARWTVVWEKKGGTWLIVHEHVSFPDATPS